jgi:hypothetical protein
MKVRPSALRMHLWTVEGFSLHLRRRDMLMTKTAFIVVAGLTLVSGLGAAEKKTSSRTSGDMRRAIAFERHKDAAAARQARLEARHPSVSRTSSAERSAEEPQAGRRVPDPGERQSNSNPEQGKGKDAR